MKCHQKFLFIAWHSLVQFCVLQKWYRHSVVDIMYCSAARCYTHARCARSPAPCVRSMFVLPINLQVNAVFSLLA